MIDYNERSRIFLAIPEEKHLEKIRTTLLTYRGRVAVTMKNMPNVTILARVTGAVLRLDDDCIVMYLKLDYGDEPKLELLCYPRDIRNYYILGVSGMAHDMAKNETGNDCPSKVQLLQMKG